mmetsp:Transcript_3464/g.5400  ORF Transcript_3464/g.5400 Transcript_3464/m.5400 type:complete len:329 (-) Transcript_3464:92-1078(-)
METPVELLFGNRVVFSDKEVFSRKLNKIRSQGPSKLNIVTDFDFTISKFFMKGERGASCHKVIEDCGLLSDDYHSRAQALQIQHYAVEVDPDISIEEKTLDMVEWVTEAHQLLIDSGLTQLMVHQAVESALHHDSLGLREKVDNFFSMLVQYQVPTLIFSAGVADVLEHVINTKYPSFDWSYVDVISNRCVFENSPSKRLLSFEEPLLHVFNKRGSAYLHTPYFSREGQASRTSLLLVGDSMGDISMSDGFEVETDCLLKIGFLNDRVERLSQYLESYDIVILDDPGFHVPLGILEAVCGVGESAVTTLERALTSTTSSACGSDTVTN